jgi:hypothetical protein
MEVEDPSHTSVKGYGTVGMAISALIFIRFAEFGLRQRSFILHWTLIYIVIGRMIRIRS